MHFSQKGSVGFTRLSMGSMTQKKVKNPCFKDTFATQGAKVRTELRWL